MGDRKEGAWSPLLAAGLAQTDDFRGGRKMVIGTRPSTRRTKVPWPSTTGLRPRWVLGGPVVVWCFGTLWFYRDLCGPSGHSCAWSVTMRVTRFCRVISCRGKRGYHWKLVFQASVCTHASGILTSRETRSRRSIWLGGYDSSPLSTPSKEKRDGCFGPGCSSVQPRG